MLKRIALFVSLVMLFTISFVFATEDTLLIAPNPNAEVMDTVNDEQTILDEVTEDVSGEVSETEEITVSGETDVTEEDTTTTDSQTTENAHDHNHDHESEQGGTVIGAIIAIIIVIAVVAIVALLQKK